MNICILFKNSYNVALSSSIKPGAIKYIVMPYCSQSMGRQLLITIGPQCAGKTTYLSSLGHVTDIAIDDIPGTYEKLSVVEILNYHEAGELTEPLRRVVYRKQMYEHVDGTASIEQLPLLLYFCEVCMYFSCMIGTC